MYRVWTKDFNQSYTIMTDWQTYAECKRMIIGRWGHWPPFTYISKARSIQSFIRYNGE